MAIKVFENKEKRARFLDYAEAATEVLYVLFVDHNDINNIFEEFDASIINPFFWDNFYAERRILEAHTPQTYRRLQPYEKLVEKIPKDNFSGIQKLSTDTYEMVKRPVEIGKRELYIFETETPKGIAPSTARLNNFLYRTALKPSDFRFWFLHHFVESYVNWDTGFFNMTDLSIPSPTDLFNPAHPKYQKLLNFSAVEVKPLRGFVSLLKRFLAIDDGMGLVTTEITKFGIHINKGLDARILAYFAQKEDIKPPCISDLL